MKKYRVWMSNDANPNGRMYYPGDEIEVGVGNHKKQHGIVLSQHGDLWSSPTDNKSESGMLGNCLSLVRWSNNGAVVMFETGLKDKNDKDIYDCDIVRIHQFLFDGTEVEHEHTGIVKYNDATASFHYTQITGKFYSEHTGHAEGEDTVGVPISTFNGLHEESFEIIGNIYENPELIPQLQTARK